MRKFADSADHGEETNYRIPVSNMIAAGLLLLLVVFAVSMKLQGDLPGSAADAEAALIAREAALMDRENDLAAREKALAENTAAVNETALIRAEIIDELEKKLSSLGLPVEINKLTGNIRFTEAVLFDVNKDTLNAEGQKNLEIFVPAYLAVLLDDRYEDYLDQIIIEGHADNGGTYLSNLYLSQGRADKVMDFILSQKLSQMPGGGTADKYFTVSARSSNDPVLAGGIPDRNQSRRVEFVFRLKDDDILEK